MESVLRVLGAVEGKTGKRLLEKFRVLVPEEMLLSLLDQTARELPSHVLSLATLIIKEPRSERAIEEAFRWIAELLSQVDLRAGAIDLADEVLKRLSNSRLGQINAVLERLSSIQLGQMNAALGACLREVGDRLDGLRLKEAYVLLREGEVDKAKCLVNTLRISLRLEMEVLRFYDRAGFSSGKVPILKRRLKAKLEEIKRDTPLLADTLRILNQLHKAELQSHKPEAADQSLVSLSQRLKP
jgi:hypothetical protein